ncbi:hypothetical protein D3C84_802310 [compost metagenome]
MLQALAQFADIGVVDPQQVVKARVIQFRVAGAPVGDFVAELALFAFQGVQTLLLRLEFGGDSHELREYVLQFRGRRGFGVARLFHVLLQLLLPLFGAAVGGEQLSERLLARLLLRGQCIELLLGGLQLLNTGLLPILFLLQVLLTLLLLGKFFLLLIELRQALGDLPIELHEGRGGLET